MYWMSVRSQWQTRYQKVANNSLTEISNTITCTITTDATNNNNNNNNNNAFSTVLIASLSFRCGVSLGCNGGDGFQVWKLSGNILNKQQQTSYKGCLPGWWLCELLTTQNLNSLLRYEVFHKNSDWKRSWKDIRIGNWKMGFGNWKVKRGDECGPHILLKWILKEWDFENPILFRSGAGDGLFKSFGEIAGVIQWGRIVDWVGNCLLFKKKSSPLNFLTGYLVNADSLRSRKSHTNTHVQKNTQTHRGFRNEISSDSSYI